MRPSSPLQWPDGWARTAAHDRPRARFQVSLHEAAVDLLLELDLMGAANVVITSDLPTRGDGLPYASGRASDPGIAVWCMIGTAEHVFACDRWDTPAANLRAIGKTVEALRGIERWGAADMVTRALGGFAALPPGDPAPELAPNPAPTPGWRQILRLTPFELDLIKLGKDADPRARKHVLEIARSNHRTAMKTAHPDAGGTHERAATLNAALRAAEEEIGV